MATPNLFKELKKKRKKIDLIDQKLLTLFNQRLRHALEIGKIKKEVEEKVYDLRREREVLRRLKLKNKGPLKRENVEELFKTIMKVCRKSQI
jgi:chorismate mutase/prephenate dehydratase